MTPYEVFFFSSGAVEEDWTVKDLGTSRLNVLVGFPLGGLSVDRDRGVRGDRPAARPDRGDVAVTGGHAGGWRPAASLPWRSSIVGIVAATFGAALETTLSSGYTLAQFFGWAWGKFRRPAEAARFHVVMLVVRDRRAPRCCSPASIRSW